MTELKIAKVGPLIPSVVVRYDPIAFPGAAAVMVVPAFAHRPDPEDSFGNEVSYHEAYDYCWCLYLTAEHGDALELEHVPRRGYVVQLWGYLLDQEEPQVRLLASGVPPAEGDEPLVVLE